MSSLFLTLVRRERNNLRAALFPSPQCIHHDLKESPWPPPPRQHLLPRRHFVVSSPSAPARATPSSGTSSTPSPASSPSAPSSSNTSSPTTRPSTALSPTPSRSSSSTPSRSS